MSALAMMALGIGVAVALGKAWGLVAPESARAFMKGFPRSRAWAWFLTGLDMAIVSALLWTLPVSWFTPWRASLFVLAPVAVFLVGWFVDELLAARALGGLLLLAAAPVLAAARLHPSDARLVMVVMAYAWVFPGMLLVANPWWFRKLAEPVMATNMRCRLISGFGVLLGLVLIGLGLWVY
jgi:hypothetical protein